MPKIKVLIVDDSAFMRKSISIMLESDPDIEIAGVARNGEEGFKLTVELKPDIVTMDIEMPVMNGLESLQKIMKHCPTPVIMISSLTTEGAQATIKALELGAIDFIPKELSYVNVNIIKIREDLINKCKQISAQRLFKRRMLPKTDFSRPVSIQKYLPVKNYRAVGIGISTGGPMSLQQIMPVLNPAIPVPIFIVQHMPPRFTKSLADRLNSISDINIKEAENGEVIKKGVVYLAPGGIHMIVRNNMICLSEYPKETLHRPSVDVTFQSISDAYGRDVLGVIMTGMGHDGTEGVKYLKSRGGSCVAQDEESCVVYGMPKSVFDAGMADVVGNLEEIPKIINKAFGL